MNRFVTLSIYLVLLYFTQNSCAQIKPFYKANITYKHKIGFIIPHSNKTSDFQNGLFSIHELHFENKLWGDKHPNKNLPKPIAGFYISYSNYNNPVLLGNIFTAVHYLKFNYLKYKSFFIQGKIATGVSYIEKSFDKEKNFRNLIIGGNWNNQTDFQIDFGYNLSKKASFLIGCGAQHNSNGSLKQPNLGINILYSSIAFHYNFVENPPKRNYEFTTKDSLKYQFYTQFSYGQKNIFKGESSFFYVFNFAPGVQFNLGKNRFITTQLDFFYDTSIPFLKKYDFDLKLKNNFLISPFISAEKVYRNLGIVLGAGYYIYSVYEKIDRDFDFVNNGGKFVHRAGLKYYFKNWYLNTNIKAHSFEADNFEFGFGKRW
jgi:hypothetical protein